jgi:hypothetical protein
MASLELKRDPILFTRKIHDSPGIRQRSAAPSGATIGPAHAAAPDVAFDAIVADRGRHLGWADDMPVLSGTIAIHDGGFAIQDSG